MKQHVIKNISVENYKQIELCKRKPNSDGRQNYKQKVPVVNVV